MFHSIEILPINYQCWSNIGFTLKLFSMNLHCCKNTDFGKIRIFETFLTSVGTMLGNCKHLKNKGIFHSNAV